ncbi:hypothetical protein DFR38_12231 [Aquitalea magnusonii]|uniref:Uncharacterized protein n=1 Tax=Aquitalea magnusonii TaxID=332411 RepID=A0A318J260_9NEIS|nr:hypothetical protein DFR38_12231 [Aquitalea magnusonii]
MSKQQHTASREQCGLSCSGAAGESHPPRQP